MQVLEFFNRKKKQQIESVQFVPSIQISPSSTLFVECSPNDPHTGSNIVLNSYQSKTDRTHLQTRIQWRRFKIISQNQHTNTHLPFITGNAYRCEPADLGFYIQAKIISFDAACNGSAEVTIGPIRMDPSVKQLVEGALYSNSLRSHIKIIQKGEQKGVDMILTNKTIKFTDQMTNKQLQMAYDMSEPKIQVNPKDPTKIFLRFQKDQTNKVRQWIDSAFQQDRFDAQSKKSFASQGSASSVSKLYKSNYKCVNKMEVAFLTRNSRDQFIFSLRAFVCKEDLKNSIVMDTIENITQLKTPADCHKFFQFMSYKLEIYRLAQLAKQLQTDRNNKLKDLQQAQQSIAQTTMTYLKIIQNKGKQLNVDFNQSYSQISMRRDQLMGKKQLRQLLQQNSVLKKRLRELTEQLQLNKYFGKKPNESMMLNQTNNPFGKKQSADSFYGPSLAYQPQQQKIPSQNVAELSKSYAILLKQNQRLRQQKRSRAMNNTNNLSKDIDMVGLLQSLHQQDEDPKVVIKKLKNQNIQLKKDNKQLQMRIQQLQNNLRKNNKSQASIKINQSVAYQQMQVNPSQKREKSLINPNQNSYLDASRQQGSFYSVNQTNINDSMTSQAVMTMLQNKIKQIEVRNKKILTQNDRLRKERNQYMELCEKLKKGGNASNLSHNLIQHKSVFSNSNFFDPQGLKQQNERLTNQKISLQKKIESLTRQLTKGGDNLLQRKCQQLTKQNNYLRQQNQSLKQRLDNVRNQSRNESFPQNYHQNGKLKQINVKLLEQIKNLKLQMQRKSNPLYNSRVIQLQNQLNYMKRANNGSSVQQAGKQLIIQISTLQKQIEKLSRENSDKQAKLQSQASIIQRLMNSQQNSFSIAGKDKSYSETRIDSQANEKLKRKIKQLQQQIVSLRRSADALNRSQDMSNQMFMYNEQQIEITKKEKQILLQENEKLLKMVEKYSKDARQASKQLIKLKQQLEMLKNQNSISLDLSHQV